MWEEIKYWFDDNMAFILGILLIIITLMSLTMGSLLMYKIITYKEVPTQCEIKQELEDLRTKMD